MRRLLLLMLCALLTICPAIAADPPETGLKVGDTVLPFTSNVVTGPYRGMQHCFVCDTGLDQPGMVVFVRQLDSATGRFVAAFRNDILKANDPPLAWFVTLGGTGTAAETDVESQVDEFASRHGLTQLNLTALGDPDGPPGYRIEDADAITAFVYRRFAVRFRRAWTTAQWNEASADKAAAELRELITRVRGPEFAKGGAKEMPGPPRTGAAPVPASVAPPGPAGAPPPPPFPGTR